MRSYSPSRQSATSFQFICLATFTKSSPLLRAGGDLTAVRCHALVDTLVTLIAAKSALCHARLSLCTALAVLAIRFGSIFAARHCCTKLSISGAPNSSTQEMEQRSLCEASAWRKMRHNKKAISNEPRCRSPFLPLGVGALAVPFAGVLQVGAPTGTTVSVIRTCMCRSSFISARANH